MKHFAPAEYEAEVTPLPPASRTLGQAWQAILVTIALIAAAFALRWPNFGNPGFHADEEFYLLVGDRMLHGAIPYVDIWDRKPIGLFLLYAAVRLLGGDGIIQYQIVATLFAGGTAALIATIARLAAGWIGGVVAGLAYLVWIATVEGGGGQSPIFYNLFVAGCALCVFKAAESTPLPRFHAYGLSAMALAGLAIQTKYTAVFEGMFFGLLLAFWSVKRERSLPIAAGWTLAYALVALAPTLAAIGAYAAMGELKPFWYANFVSIFARAPAIPAEIHMRLRQMVMHVLPFAVCIGASIWHLRIRRDPEIRRWQAMMAGWLVFAFIGFFSIGALFPHYTLPLFVPLSIAAAPIFRRIPIGPVLGGLLLWLPLSHSPYPDLSTTNYGRAKIAALMRLIPADVDRGCMQMFAGPPILYKLSNACFVTPYIFPDHLLGAKETHAIGVDQAAEVARTMAKRPRVVISDDTPRDWNPPSQATLRRMRDPYYSRTGRVWMDGSPYDVWVRRVP